MEIKEGAFVFVRPEKNWGIVQETQDENHILVCLTRAIQFFKEADLIPYFQISDHIMEVGVSDRDVLDMMREKKEEIAIAQAGIISDLQQQVSDLQKKVAELVKEVRIAERNASIARSRSPMRF